MCQYGVKTLLAILPSGGGALVSFVLTEKKIPFEVVTIDLEAKEHKAPEFRALHPFGQLPVLDEDGFILYEARAICRYIEEKYADQCTSLLPKGLKERALVEQAVSAELANFLPHAMKAAHEVTGQSPRGLNADQTVVDEAVAALAATLDVYEVLLGKHRFIAGDEFTLADVFHYAYAPLLAENGVDVMTKNGPNWNEVISYPTWRKLKAEGIKGTVI
ncbi:glutathione S-transferase [Mycena albidolilacea]|uniref:glutathione transferase n=1 Tax=Mycena albidolilacea TaxID=1033008 RepID=A0AAD6ZWA4_9AGAR|nr:glutathione S-transferase [Mycena albidolilacea]